MTSRALRPVVDSVMTILLLLLMAYETVGPALADLCAALFGVSIDGYELGPVMHEALGITFVLLVLLHLWLNRRWLAGIFRGRYTAARALLVSADALLIVGVAALLVSGVTMSKVLALPEDFGGMDLARTAHLLAAYWGFVIMSFHAGLHWRKFPLWVLAPMAYGAWAFVKRQLGEYMFLRSQFVFFDYEEPILYFLLDYIAIMILFAGLGCCAIRLCRKMDARG